MFSLLNPPLFYIFSFSLSYSVLSPLDWVFPSSSSPSFMFLIISLLHRQSNFPPSKNLSSVYICKTINYFIISTVSLLSLAHSITHSLPPSTRRPTWRQCKNWTWRGRSCRRPTQSLTTPVSAPRRPSRRLSVPRRNATTDSWHSSSTCLTRLMAYTRWGGEERHSVGFIDWFICHCHLTYFFVTYFFCWEY